MKWILLRSYFVFWINAPICQMFHCLFIAKLIPVLLANSYPKYRVNWPRVRWRWGTWEEGTEDNWVSDAC